jgi:hypothetical protein
VIQAVRENTRTAAAMGAPAFRRGIGLSGPEEGDLRGCRPASPLDVHCDL